MGINVGFSQSCGLPPTVVTTVSEYLDRVAE
jgi:hypothetical protein